MIKQFSILLLIAVFALPVLGQETKKPIVLIVGTMHEVPKIVKNSYRPLLKQAIEFGPDAIYVERQRPDDSLSLINYESNWFLPFGDSLKKSFEADTCRTKKLVKQSVFDMTRSDYEYLSTYYAIARDKANWHYYSYLAKYGLNGSLKPLRREGGDLTAKLAIKMNMNKIYSMDHQHGNKDYHKLWRQCIKESQVDGEVKYLVKINKKSYRKAIFPALIGRLGKHTNRIKTLQSYDPGNRFTFRKTECEPCIQAGQIWDQRNAGMAKNIGEQVLANKQNRAIVIVGAGHVLGIRDSLLDQFPELDVRILNQM
ncbi:DUF5694 domain-containing protein [Ekhidna sp.]